MVGRPVDRSDPRFWRAGVFYCNPDDPDLWVERRWGVGLTLNYAKPVAWGITGTLLALPVIVVSLLYVLTR